MSFRYLTKAARPLNVFRSTRLSQQTVRSPARWGSTTSQAAKPEPSFVETDRNWIVSKITYWVRFILLIYFFIDRLSYCFCSLSNYICSILVLELLI